MNVVVFALSGKGKPAGWWMRPHWDGIFQNLSASIAASEFHASMDMIPAPGEGQFVFELFICVG
jgi:hypothetical protein